MSENMVERVARAICKSQDLDWDAQASPFTSASGSDEEQEGFRMMARAAIEAMREPTEEMLSAGDSMMPQIAKGEDITTGYDALRDAWPAMITAALTPRETSS